MLEAAKHTSATPQNTEEEEAKNYNATRFTKIQSMNYSIRYGYLHNGVKKTIRKPVNFYFSPSMATNDKAVMMSAVTLNLLQLFDCRKIPCLLTAYQQTQRARLLPSGH